MHVCVQESVCVYFMCHIKNYLVDLVNISIYKVIFNTVPSCWHFYHPGKFLFFRTLHLLVFGLTISICHAKIN